MKLKKKGEQIYKKKPFRLLLIAIVGLIAYSNTFDVPFQFDDFDNISDNPLIRNLDNFISSAKGYDYNPRRYIGYLTFALNYHFGGLDVTGYHIVNLTVHVLNAFLVYFFVVLTFRTPYFRNQQSAVSHNPLSSPFSLGGEQGRGTQFTLYDSRFIALFAALLFVAHPVQTQAVTYIVQRFTSLATLFYLLSVVLYIKGRLTLQQPLTVSNQQSAIGDSPHSDPPDLTKEKREDIHSNEGTEEGAVHALKSSQCPIQVSQIAVSAAWYLCSLVSAVLAMKTKEIAFTLPVVILLYEFVFFGSGLKKKMLFLVPVLLTLAIIPVSIMGVNKPLGDILSDLSERTRVATSISRWDYLATQMRVITTYVRLIFLPVRQNLDYSYPEYYSFLTPAVFLSALFLLFLFGIAAYLLYRSRSSKEQSALSRLIAFGILWFFITLSVESSIIPIADVIFEHRLYLPSAGAFVAIAAVMCGAAGKSGKLWLSGRKVLIPFALIIIALSATAYARNSVWKDRETLWEDVVEKAPDNARAHNNLGFIYYEKNMLDQAASQFTTALRLMPSYQDARMNLGIIYNAEGMPDQAIEQFRIVLSVNPDDADAHNNLGIAYVSKGMIDQGIIHYQIALRLKPDYPEAYNNLGVAFSSEGRFSEAIGYFKHAILLKPDYSAARHNLSLAYEKMVR